MRDWWKSILSVMNILSMILILIGIATTFAGLYTHDFEMRVSGEFDTAFGCIIGLQVWRLRDIDDRKTRT